MKILINYTYIFGLSLSFMLTGCTKSFLEEKPGTDIVAPQTLDDFFNLMENSNIVLTTGAIGHMSSDEYEYTDYAAWQGASTSTERNCYIWAKDIFESEIERPDWNKMYKAVFYANCVLDGLKKLDHEPNKEKFNQLKGWALFARSLAFYDLVSHFSSAYDPQNANRDLGIPLRESPGIDELVQRATVQQTYDKITADLKQAAELLTAEFQTKYRNRPSKVAAYALLARVYLSMNKYQEAEGYADQTLTKYSKLMDFNSISKTSTTPFTNTNEEVIYSCQQIPGIYFTTAIGTPTNTSIKLNDAFVNSYAANDLRFSIYFAKNALGNYYMKRGYYGSNTYLFSGLATDEMFLIKAECLARRNQTLSSMNTLNALLINRTSNATPYVDITAASPAEALAKILLERRKEMIWRGVRWTDLKRLNKIGANITLTRTLNGKEYILPPNDPKYILPIPDEEIQSSGIQQNIR